MNCGRCNKKHCKNGYEVVIVWECDFRKDSDKQLRRISDAISKKRAIGN